MKEYVCLNCGTVKKSLRSSKNKFCNNVCQKEHEYNLAIEAWIKDNKPITKRQAKKWLGKQKCGCYECGLTQWQDKPIVLELDHIDGNARHNRPENLRLLCPNCHSQTDSFKNKNRGKGRKLGTQEGWILY